MYKVTKSTRIERSNLTLDQLTYLIDEISKRENEPFSDYEITIKPDYVNLVVTTEKNKILSDTSDILNNILDSILNNIIDNSIELSKSEDYDK